MRKPMRKHAKEQCPFWAVCGPIWCMVDRGEEAANTSIQAGFSGSSATTPCSAAASPPRRGSRTGRACCARGGRACSRSTSAEAAPASGGGYRPSPDGGLVTQRPCGAKMRRRGSSRTARKPAVGMAVTLRTLHPSECPAVDDVEVFCEGRARCAEVAVPAPALYAVAEKNAAKWPAYP